MDPINTFCLAAIVFLSLPLPLFAGRVLEHRPSVRRPLLRWVWANQAAGAAAGLSLIATPLSPWLGLTLVLISFVWCGMGMCQVAARPGEVTP